VTLSVRDFSPRFALGRKAGTERSAPATRVYAVVSEQMSEEALELFVDH
jgi:hypothetical protein